MSESPEPGVGLCPSSELGPAAFKRYFPNLNEEYVEMLMKERTAALNFLAKIFYEQDVIVALTVYPFETDEIVIYNILKKWGCPKRNKKGTSSKKSSKRN